MLKHKSPEQVNQSPVVTPFPKLLQLVDARDAMPNQNAVQPESVAMTLNRKPPAITYGTVVLVFVLYSII